MEPGTLLLRRGKHARTSSSLESGRARTVADTLSLEHGTRKTWWYPGGAPRSCWPPPDENARRAVVCVVMPKRRSLRLTTQALALVAHPGYGKKKGLPPEAPRPSFSYEEDVAERQDGVKHMRARW